MAAGRVWWVASGDGYSESVNAQRMRPYMPGAVGGGGPYKRGTTVISYLCIWVKLNVLYSLPKRKKHLTKEFSIKCHTHNVGASNQLKYLGLVMDTNLSGQVTVMSIVK